MKLAVVPVAILTTCILSSCGAPADVATPAPTPEAALQATPDATFNDDFETGGTDQWSEGGAATATPADQTTQAAPTPES